MNIKYIHDKNISHEYKCFFVATNILNHEKMVAASLLLFFFRKDCSYELKNILE